MRRGLLEIHSTLEHQVFKVSSPYILTWLQRNFAQHKRVERDSSIEKCLLFVSLTSY